MKIKIKWQTANKKKTVLQFKAINQHPPMRSHGATSVKLFGLEEYCL